MSKEGEILEEVVSPLLKELENVKSETEKYNKNVIDKLERKVQELENIKSETEKYNKNEIDKLEREVQDVKALLEEHKKRENEIDEVERKGLKEDEILEEVVSPLPKELENVKSKTKEDNKNEIDKLERKVQELENIKSKTEKYNKNKIDKLEREVQDAKALLEGPKKCENGIDKVKREVQGLKAFLEGLKKCERKSVQALGLMGRDIDIILANLEENQPIDVKRIMQRGELVEIEKLEVMSTKINEFHESIESMLGMGKKSLDGSQPSTSGNAETSAEAGRQKMGELLMIPTMWSYVKEAFLSLDLQGKRCMFCMLLFPENSIMKKRMLIYSWIAAGFVQGTGQTAEENGEACFQKLVTKYLIYPIYKKHRAVADGCVLPHEIRQKVISVAQTEQFFVNSLVLDMKKITESIEDVTPLNVAKSRSLPDQPLMLFSINTKERVNLSFGTDSYPVIEKMGVLHIGRWQRDSDGEKTKQHIEVKSTEFLEKLEPAHKLRYLSMVGISRITELPKSIGKLSHLVILDLRACHNLEKLPASIGSLKKLTHLDVSECYLLEHLPRGLSLLSGMQVLKGFVVANSRSNDPCRFQDLAKLENLRKLTMSIGRDSQISGDFDLSTWKALRSLTVTWGIQMEKPDIRCSISPPPELEKLDIRCSISPPPELEKLDIRCFPMEEVQWLTADKFSSLKRLYIRGGRLARLPHASDFSKLEVLRVRFLKHIKFSREDLNSFRKLAYLEIHECDEVDAGAFEWVKTINKNHRYPRSLI